MQSFYQMNDEDFVRHVTMIAHAFAANAYLREHPGSNDDAAWAYAVAEWEKFVDKALTCIAFLEALREAEVAAPNN